jgi:transcriptional regulator with XRE-family HTH domain
MKTIGEKILEIRKSKGLTQEYLSEKAKINLRTLQRIENDETDPRGHTLHALCEVLEVNVEDILDYAKKEDNQFLVYFHLSVILGIVIPLGDIIVPLILWLTQKNKIVSLAEQGINVLNFRICWQIIYLLSSVLYVYHKIVSSGVPMGDSILYLLAAHILITVLYPIYIAVSIYRRKNLRLYYPKWIKIIR